MLWKKPKFSRDPAKRADYKKISNFVKDNLNNIYFSYVKDLPASLIKDQSETLLVICEIIYKETEHTRLYNIQQNSRINSRG